jgi:hypothetical protein
MCNTSEVIANHRPIRIANRRQGFAFEAIATGKRRLATLCLLASLSVSFSTAANAGIRAPGKYSGVVIFDRWGGCILFSGIYLMYISETVKNQLRQYDGQAIEIDALDVFQPNNPGDGLIRRLSVLGPAESQGWYSVEGLKLVAQPIATEGSRTSLELTITNEGNAPTKINSSQIGFVLLSQKVEGLSTPSDGPSTAVITRANVFLGKGTWGLGTGERVYSYSYGIADEAKLPEIFELAPHESRSTKMTFQLPEGHYQFFAGYGGGVHESKSIVSNPVSIERWE